MRFLFPIALLTWVMSLFFAREPRITATADARRAFRQPVYLCSPLRDRTWSVPTIGVLPGAGKHHWAIATKSDSAQVYFDQGMNLYYSFHIIEALASFIKAENFDPEVAAPYWAEALAYGPNINDNGYAAAPDVFPAVKNAVSKKKPGASVIIELIEAIRLRYSDAPGVDQAALNKKYSDAMAQVYRRHPTDPDVIALYADALMNLHPWDLYDHDGAPKPWTGELVSLLEQGLRIDPRHPGLNHYYIHAVEASRDPGRALPNAARLGELTPGVAHMVHMPAHIYIRTGNYAEGMKVNVSALKGYDNYLSLYPQVVGSVFLYQWHNTHLLASCAIMSGEYGAAKKSAESCRNDITPDAYAFPSPMKELVEYLAATPVFAAVRYGQWDELLAMPDAPDSLLYMKILTTWGKGMAHARKGALSAARKDLSDIQTWMESDPGMKLKLGAFNSAHDGAVVAAGMLEGAIAEASGDLKAAVSAYRAAVEAERAMVYNEPKDWILPPLPYLGAAQLKAGDAKGAEASFRKDLEFNPHNVWALKGLCMALETQGKKQECAPIQAELTKALKGTALELKSPVF